MVQVLVGHRRAICSMAVVLKLWLDHVDARRKSFQVYVNLLLLVGAELDHDTPDASRSL